jgi:hypothetical protein
VERALDAGGKDNVTVIVAAYRLPEDTTRLREDASDDADTQAPTSGDRGPRS